MADIIQLLPDHVANQIAAGEVVQRPASVVKELLENAIDANATTIKLIIKDAGKTLIQVIDNGKGMSVTDARLSFERHATSKIRTAEDLFQLNTKGFRGEALASIAAIAHIELKTKQDEDDMGTAIVIEGSQVIHQDVVVTPTGTSVAVKNLFFNIPARRNFLKSDQVELRYILDEFHRVALVHHTINFVLYNNGSESLNLPIANFRQRIVAIFGGKANEKLVPVEEQTEILKISGFVNKPEFAKKSRNEQFFFVNDRFIKSGYLNHAINAAFEGLLKRDENPSYFLKLTVRPETIDINIHPTKTEIKFDDEHTLYALLRAAVKHSLGQFNIAPILDFETDTAINLPYHMQREPVKSPQIEVDRNFNPFQNTKSANRGALNFFKQHSATEIDSQIEFISQTYKTESNFEDAMPIPTAFENEIKQQYSTFQLQNKYIVSAIKSGLLIIDQNKAQQRILYENFLKQITGKAIMSQQLLFPLNLQFSNPHMAIIKNMQLELEASGFMFNKMLSEEIEISGIPQNIEDSDVYRILEQLVHDVENEIPNSYFSAADLLSKSMAKSIAIKNSTAMSKEAQEHLVNELFACKEPTVSPAFKKTFITISIEELEKKFN